ncbi:MAG: hypothetical protein LBP50_08875 [Tannerella sp.]|nr:hypothetical protein [Tannerella sp.]
MKRNSEKNKKHVPCISLQGKKNVTALRNMEEQHLLIYGKVLFYYSFEDANIHRNSLPADRENKKIDLAGAEAPKSLPAAFPGKASGATGRFTLPAPRDDRQHPPPRRQDATLRAPVCLRRLLFVAVPPSNPPNGCKSAVDNLQKVATSNLIPPN